MSKVRTVTGTVDSSELGLVLPHEHLHNDVTGAYTEAPDPVVAQRLAGPVRAEDAWLLHDNPYYSLDNCRVDDGSAVVEDLADFARLGGRTIVDLTPPGLGRAPEKLAEFSRKSDVRVIMGSGWYLETTHPVEVHELGVDDLAGSLVEEFDPAKELAPGVIGEIGVSPLFTQNEAKALRAACIAQREVGVPLVGHPPGRHRVGPPVCDVLCGTTLDLGRMRLDTAFLTWRMDGRTGVGRYDILRRTEED